MPLYNEGSERNLQVAAIDVVMGGHRDSAMHSLELYIYLKMTLSGCLSPLRMLQKSIIDWVA
jgi:hypothetical protein